MKKTKRTSKVLWMLFLSFCIFLGSALSASAEDEIANYPPSKVHITTGSNEYNNFPGAAAFHLQAAGDSIANLRSSSSNLLVWQTFKDIRQDTGCLNVCLGMFAKKSGTYTVRFDILNKNGKKKSSKKITVYADKNQPYKSITYAGKKVNKSLCVTSPTSGKLKVTMNSGYKLKKIELGTVKTTKTQNGTTSKLVYKTVKNNSTIKLSKKCWMTDTKEGNLKKGYYYEYYGTTMWADNEIRITYVDKYTGKTVVDTSHDILLLAKQ